MLQRLRPALLLFLTLSALGALGLAHEDDPKILDRMGPYNGPGFRRANLNQPGQLALGGTPFSSSGVSLLSWVTLAEMGSPQSGADCWGYTSPSGREFVLMGHSLGFAVVDISVPTNAQVIANLSGPSSLWRDIKVYGNHAYVVSEGGGGIHIFSLAQIDSGVVTQVGSVITGGSTSTHNVAINEASGYLYRLGGASNGMRIYDLGADPVNPPLVGSWSSRYIHDAQVVSYTSGPNAGKEIVFACSGLNGGFSNTGLDIIDVTNKNNISVLGNTSYNNPAYSHQGWLSPDRQYFYLGDELDENGSLPTTTHVIAVSNLSNPQSLTSFTNGNQAVGHNLYTEGNLIYEANYRSGLRIFDASNPTSPVEVAFFDTYPDNDLDGFNGLWSVYPYFQSGTVVGSDLERGLFVWWTGPNPLVLDLPAGPLSLVNPGGDSMAVTITEATPGDLVPGSALLHINDGAGWVSLPLTALGGANFQADFPAFACGTALQYYLTADATSGSTWSLPTGAPFDLYAASAALGQTTMVSHDFEAASGWTVGAAGDSASTGIWTRVNPRGTAAQPEDDHTVAGSECFVTGQGSVGGSLGENDVDGGNTTLVSPVFDLSSSSSPRVSYWRWFSNDQGSSSAEDVLEVEITGDGANWILVETVGPTGAQSSGGWFEHSLLVSDFVALSSQVRLRFRTGDLGAGSIVEAAIDDLEISDIDCGTGCGASSYCVATANSAGGGALLTALGSSSLAANDLVLSIGGAPVNQPGLFYYGSTQISTPFGDGVRCVGGGISRFNPALISDAGGQVSRSIDLTLPPASSGVGQISAGDTWNFQFWYRDPSAGASGFNLSDGLSIVFCP